jgi:hypothetical protein
LRDLPTPAKGKEAPQGNPEVRELPLEQEDVQPSLGSANIPPRKRRSLGSDGKGAPKPKKSVGDVLPQSGDPDPDVAEAAGARKDDMSESSSSDKSSSLSFVSGTEYLSDLYVIIDAQVKKNGLLVLATLLRPGNIQDIRAHT